MRAPLERAPRKARGDVPNGVVAGNVSQWPCGNFRVADGPRTWRYTFAMQSFRTTILLICARRRDAADRTQNCRKATRATS
ncbi:hypothetical protein SB776_34310, partial [Burkholderia sp. SIMBA_045]